ncbi:MAG: CBS domain-containing protein [Elusimicrobia bacterium]|nr:CBS domain-containing protein [Elusimicrobiota bacterium]
MFDTMQHKTSGSKMLEDFISASPDKAALSFEQTALSEAVFWLSGLRASSIISCLENMNPKKAAFLLRRLHIKQAARIMQGLKAERAGEIMLDLPIHYKKRLIDALDPSQIKALEEVLAYPRASAARFMKSDFITFKTDAKVKDIITRIKTLPSPKVPLAVYILDKAGKLCGVLPTSQLSFYPPESLAGSVMTADFIKLSPFDGVKKAKALLLKNNLAMLPVIDSESVLLGVVSLWSLQGCDKEEASSAPSTVGGAPKNTVSVNLKPALIALLFVLVTLVSFAIFKLI